ncbi:MULTISPECIES: discoidin domain-containing protein [unclassified Carboxylicivirga]|uniref:discoidin domain-containing protein n=1 Tax=Carboxylicivirga TaxID=1628153 RepID=UPI003D3527B8
MKLLYFSFLSVLLAIMTVSCSDDDETVAPPPSAISEVRVEPRVGGAAIFWNVPADSNYLYVAARFEKKESMVKQLASVYSDSILVEGLLNKFEYDFSLQTYNADEVGGEILHTEKVRPIRRPIEVTYSLDDAVEVPLTADMIDTYTQEQSEGPKENLLDDNINTYWHSAWSSGKAPLPHHIQINFEEPTKLGAFNYTLRQGGNDQHDPKRFDLQVSEDGATWETVWVSAPNLPIAPETDEFTLNMNKNFESKYFRIRIIETAANGQWTYLSGIEVLSLGEELTDLEEVAEENY